MTPSEPERVKLGVEYLKLFASRFEPFRALLVRYYAGRAGTDRAHPIDRAYGIRTSTFIPGHALLRDAAAAKSTAYAAAQPSIVRYALNQIPDPQNWIFLDLGSGMGRILVVASEYPFREVVGVELSPTLAVLAEQNIEIVRQRHPNRSPIRVVTGDALAYDLPDAPLVVFLYRPFARDGTERLVRRLEAKLVQSSHPLTVVFYNPVWADVLDASKELVRTHAVSVPYDDSEIGFGPDESDTIAIWKDRQHVSVVDPQAAARRILVSNSGWRAELAPADALADRPSPGGDGDRIA